MNSLKFILQSGQKHSFTFDQVFMPDATQDDVFVEISQLVQSALDGYKVINQLHMLKSFYVYYQSNTFIVFV